MNKCNESRAKKPLIVAGPKAGRATILGKKNAAAKPTIFQHLFPAFGRLLRCLPDTFLYKQLAILIDKLECWLTCEPERSSYILDVNDGICLLRYPDTLALSTSVQNLGTVEFMLYEDGLLIGLIQPEEIRFLPLSGRLMVEGRCATGESTSVLITTLQRCLCGDPAPPYHYSSNQPVGGNLL